MEPYVIVGNGVAGINAVEAIRARGDTTPIVLFTDQECAFYSRPSLYYIMLGRIEPNDAWGRPDDFYQRSGVDLQCGATVSKLNPEAHTVEVEGQGEVSYSRILLALGTSGRVLPWADQDLRGIVTLNTLLDVVGITELLGDSRGAVVVGGGLTSIELVEVCRHWGVPTAFVMRDDRFLSKQLTYEEAAIIQARLRAGGVDIRTNEEIIEVTGEDGWVARAVTKSGDEIACDIAACTVGIVPNTGLVEAAGGEVDRGVVVDDHMLTTLPDVYSAGDCAQVRGPDGKPQRSELLWYVAADMGRAAGANMAGGDETYRKRVFLNAAEFCGVDFCGVGSITPGQPEVEEIVIRGRGAEGSIRLVLRDGVLIGACFLGDTRLADIARGLIAKKARLADLHSDHPLRHLLERSSP
ncbi:MAG: NAD(P)/FAD-dependent oxidoreductase [Armatimonadota bacterium]|nr:MAG: NAD(P)/FAD-dependent oxidoreductase [Armatimonadota bacterium]